MACKYRIKGVDGEFTEAELKAYLANGGKAAYEQIGNVPIISDKNRAVMDKEIEKIISRDTTKNKVLQSINALNVSDETKNRLINYLNNELKEKKKGTYEGLIDLEKNFYDNYENLFLNKQMSYENIMHQLGSIADNQPTPELKEKYNNIRNIFYAQNSKKAQRQAKETEVKESENFNDDINNTRLGLSEEEFRLYDQAERITARGTVDFVNDTTLKDKNDQVVQTFQLNEFGNDLNNLLMKFQMKYGADKYLDEMQKFVADEKNQLDARIAVSTILNNHLENLITQSTNPNETVRLKSIALKNAQGSQPIARRVSLALNALRAWNGLTNSQQAWLGIINPPLQNNYDNVVDALGSEITDEDLADVEDGKLNIYEDEGTPAPEPESTKKTAGYFKRKSVKNNAKLIQTKDEKQVKQDIEEQKKKCK
jgi:hypothetical protein